MWLLTNDGDLFEGKKRWLRPGSTHLLGRTSSRAEGGERIQYIDHKSVSRKHLVIEVGTVKSGDSSHLFTRSQITLTDASKIGTTLNGDNFVKESRIINGKEHTIKLGSYEHLFHLSWHPVTLSFTSGSKKSKEEAIAQRRDQLEQADIKITTDYVTNETTHALAKKRNTPPALHALIQARWTITEAFADAVVKAVARQAEPDDLTPLEQDFDANWPSEEEYVVPAAGEPQPRPDSFLNPNKDRMEIFQDYVFVFLTQSQYDTLLPVITAGSGKALLRDVEPGDSTVEDVVEYIKEVAGRKGSNQFKLSQLGGKGGVVVVRLNERDGALRKFQQDIDVALDQRSIEQNEFLDAILTVDASGLRRALPETINDDEGDGDTVHPTLRSRSEQKKQQQRAVTVVESPPADHEVPRGQPEQQDNAAAEEQPPEQPSATARKRNRRVITQSRFKGFDDFDPSQFSKAVSGSPEPASQEPSQAASAQGMDVDGPSQTQTNNRKRRAAMQEEQNEEDMYASILTSHAAMKRQKIQAEGGEGFASNSVAEHGGASAAKPAKGKKKAKEQDVMAEVKARREKQEEQRRKDEEYLRNAGEEIDVEEAKKLVQVEEMEMPVRERPVRSTTNNTTQSDRWDPAWNGRKNFKQFRRQGENRDRPRLQRVMVALEEVPRKGRGMGDEYWLASTASTNKSKSKSQSQSQSQPARTNAGKSQRSANNEEEEEEDDVTRFRRGLQRSRDEDEANDAAERILPEEIAGRPRDEGIQAAVDSTPSLTFASDSQRKAVGKRPATTQQVGGPAKKAKTQTRKEVISLDEDDEDDGLKFRRRAR